MQTIFNLIKESFDKTTEEMLEKSDKEIQLLEDRWIFDNAALLISKLSIEKQTIIFVNSERGKQVSAYQQQTLLEDLVFSFKDRLQTYQQNSLAYFQDELKSIQKLEATQTEFWKNLSESKGSNENSLLMLDKQKLQEANLKNAIKELKVKIRDFQKVCSENDDVFQKIGQDSDERIIRKSPLFEMTEHKREGFQRFPQWPTDKYLKNLSKEDFDKLAIDKIRFRLFYNKPKDEKIVRLGMEISGKKSDFFGKSSHDVVFHRDLEGSGCIKTIKVYTDKNGLGSIVFIDKDEKELMHIGFLLPEESYQHKFDLEEGERLLGFFGSQDDLSMTGVGFVVGK